MVEIGDSFNTGMLSHVIYHHNIKKRFVYYLNYSTPYNLTTDRPLILIAGRKRDGRTATMLSADKQKAMCCALCMIHVNEIFS